MTELWNLLHEREIPAAHFLAPLLACCAIVLLGVLLHLLLRPLARTWLPALARRTRTTFDETLIRRGVLDRLITLAPAILVHALAGAWLGPDTPMQAWGEALQTGAHLWILVAGLLALHAVLDGLTDIYGTLPFARQLPIRTLVQALKLVAALAVAILCLAILLGKSPVILVSGMGALTAILMLVFKDPILGFVAGIQLSANKMLAVGDWLEMPKYGADGDVVDMTLTTVKVQNWDKTITTVPTYALISDSFKNWRGMTETGGRRIKRSLFIDMHSIRFLQPADVERLRQAQLLAGYIDQKIEDIERYNRQHQIDPSSPINGRRLTNVGTFRAYLASYLRAHPAIHRDLTCMVRQLQPTEAGLPIEIYAFTSDTRWAVYEDIQSDIFDHILAVAPEFGLRVFQNPSGADLRALRSPEPGAAAPPA